ncbi:MAG: S8 family serine peptidase [Deltaproteobacteria bacterium]|nr:S8 family serine peptidase [Deltaproteobacteria bacterium]
MVGWTGKAFRWAVLGVALLLPAASRAEGRRFLVKLRDPTQGMQALRGAGASIEHVLAEQRAAAVVLPEESLEKLRRDPDIEYVEQDPRRYPFAQTVPYGIDLVQAPLVWPRAGDASRTLCLIDSGYSLGHEDLQRLNLSGYPKTWSSDGCGHGTHVAGIIGALDNAVGVVGTLPNGVRLHVVRVFGADCGWTYASTLIDALNRCRAAGAHVVNMSLGGPASSILEEWAFLDASNAGTLLVAAAGNDGSTSFSYPASYPSVVSVAALDASKRLASFSQRNAQVDLAAPGVAVLSTVPWTADGRAGSGYESWSGTSMAAPHVSGVAALVWSQNPGWTQAQIRQALEATAEDLGPAGRDDGFGFGLVRAGAALDHLLGTGGRPPAASFTATCSGLACSFTDTSSDPDDDLSLWAWDFGDGATSSAQAPAHSFAAAGTYQVSLRVTDATGLSSLALQPVEVAEAPFSLSARAYKVRKERRIDLSWSGATTPSVEVFRDGAPLDTTANDGTYTDLAGTRSGSSVYRVCESPSTRCSNEVPVAY